MGLISKPYTFSSGATIVASEHNSNFDTAYNVINGNLDNANIKANAAIADSKLAQITTASKVSGAAFTNLANIPAGAGVIPAANLQAASQVNLTTGVVGVLPRANGGLDSTIANNIANGVVFLDANAKLPAVDGSQLTGLSTGGYTGMQVFTSSGTWTKPAGITKCLVECIGGGSGSSGPSATGGAGGDTTFVGSTTIAGNGAAADGSGGTASGGSLNLSGKTGLGVARGYPYGIWQETYGIGGTAAGGYTSGGGGGYAKGVIAVTGNVAVTVGAGGTTGGNSVGTAGLVIVYW